MRAVQVWEVSQVAEARRAGTASARSMGFNEVDTGRVAIVVTELATNVLKHGGGGSVLIGEFEDGNESGIECLALDQGPGMADVPLSQQDGHSTAGSLGTGLGAVGRIADVTDIYSRPGSGTAVLARLGRTGSALRADSGFGVVAVPMAGETTNGDGWCRQRWNGGWTLMLADGLGHGPYAAAASHEAARAFGQADPASAPGDLLAQMHGSMRATRGAAVSIARVDGAAGAVVFGGVGNVAGVLVGADGSLRRMVTNNGTVGHIAKHMREFTYPLANAAMLVMASDGLATSWRMDSYPGLLGCHPTLLAGVLYRDFSRGRDDVTVMACRIDHRMAAS